ncbi:unnamed protein product [Echinostoma caproni]|uniref:DUF551 domain-containing protein n=1 Tax=Echinostoma caproni TaxID=27848 RepID=A0A183BE65_9TREM|nr:unnamed protein product [Echinostoma caproni]
MKLSGLGLGQAAIVGRFWVDGSPTLIRGGLQCYYSAASDHVFWQPIPQWDHHAGEEPCLELQPTLMTLESEAMPPGATFRDHRE